MMNVWLVRHGSGVYWRMLGLRIGGRVVLGGWWGILSDCDFEDWIGALCGCDFENLWVVLCGGGNVSL